MQQKSSVPLFTGSSSSDSSLSSDEVPGLALLSLFAKHAGRVLAKLVSSDEVFVPALLSLLAEDAGWALSTDSVAPAARAATCMPVTALLDTWVAALSDPLLDQCFLPSNHFEVTHQSLVS